MASDRSRLNGIKLRWKTEHKINASDVAWLIEEAENAETMRAADSLRARDDPLNDILGGLFRRR